MCLFVQAIVGLLDVDAQNKETSQVYNVSMFRIQAAGHLQCKTNYVTVVEAFTLTMSYPFADCSTFVMSNLDDMDEC